MASYPILYPASVNAISDIYNSETASYALGYGALSNAISTSTVSSINDSYEFSMEYPVEDSFLFQNLVVGNKILAEHDCTGDLQLFEIRNTSYSLDKKTIVVDCVHVSYATDGIVCCPDQTMMREDDPDIKQYTSFVECTSLQAASKWITDNAKGVNPFTLDVTAHYGNHLHNSRVPLTEEAFDRYYHANAFHINNSSVLEVTTACPEPCLGRTKLWGNNSWTLSIDLKGGETATIKALYFEKEDSTEPVRTTVLNSFDTTLSWQRYTTDEIVGDGAYPYVVIQISGIGVEARLWMLEETRAYSGHWEETNNDKYWRFQSAPITYRKALNGDEDTSLVATYGGELLFDNYTIRLLSRLGQDRGMTIRYAKNLSDLTDETDGTNIFGGIVPYYTDGNGTCHWFGNKPSQGIPADGVVYSDWYDPNDPLRRRLCILDVTEHFAPEYDLANKNYQDKIDAANAEVKKYSDELTRISARLDAYNDAKSKSKEAGKDKTKSKKKDSDTEETSTVPTWAYVTYEIDGITYSETAGPYDEAGWTNQIDIMTYSQNQNKDWQSQAQSILDKAQKDQEKMKTWQPNYSGVINYCKAYMNENQSHRALRNLEIKIQNKDPEIGIDNADIITLGDTASVIGDMYPADYNGGYWTDYMPTVPNMDYHFYGEPSALRLGDKIRVLWYDENKVVIDDNWTIVVNKSDEQANHVESSYICPNSAAYVRVCWPKYWGTSTADLGLMHNGIDDLIDATISEVPGDTPMQYISRVIELDWNMLEGCYNSITLGDAQEKLTNVLTDGVNSAIGRTNAIIIQTANNNQLTNITASNEINKLDNSITETRNTLTESIVRVTNSTQKQIDRSDEEIQRINALAAETAASVREQAEQIREVIQEATNITEELHESVDSLSADILAVAKDADALSEELTEQMQAVDTNIADIQSRIDGVVALSDDMQTQINELELGTVDPETLAAAIETVKADIPTDEKIEQLASLKDEELAAVITAYVQNGYVSNEALAEADYATELWVENQDYATESYADGKASTAKSEAISAAATDATTKANNAQSTAISTAAADATTKANNAKSSAISETKTWVNQQGFGSANDIATLRASLLETTNTVASNKTELLAKFDNYVATGDLNDAITRTDIMQATEASMYDLEFAQGKYLARKCRLVMPNTWGAGGKTKERSVEQRPGGTATWLPYSKLYYWYTSDVSIGTLADADLWWQYDEDWYSSASVARQIAAYKFKDSDGVMHISDPCTMIQCRFNTSNYPSAIQAHIWNFTLQDVEWNNYNTSSARPTSWTYHAQIDTANVSTATSGTESYAYITRESMDLVFTLSSAGALKVKMYYISDRFCPQASAYNGNKVTKRWQVGSDSTQLKYMFLSELGDQFQLMWEEFFYQRSGSTVFISSMSTDANWDIGTIATWSAGGYNTNAGQTTIYAWAELYDGTSASTNKYKGMYCPFKVVCWVESGKLKAMVPHMRRQYEDYADAHGWPDRNLGFNSWFLGWGQINGLRDGTGLYES